MDVCYVLEGEVLALLGATVQTVYFIFDLADIIHCHHRFSILHPHDMSQNLLEFLLFELFVFYVVSVADSSKHFDWLVNAVSVKADAKILKSQVVVFVYALLDSF